MNRAAIYARFSSDRQRDASIEDQVRLCRERLERDGHSLVQTYVDRAQSGASMLRGGLQALIEDAMAARFDIVMTEALDRLSRDQADIAALHKRLAFAGVTIVTLAEGPINELHIGLKGTMNQLFLKDLADKTRRGLRGRVEAGRSGGGNAYGYDVVRSFAATGEPQRGERVVNAAEAQIVRRIFGAYAAGASPRAIAVSLNADGVRGPSGEAWGSSTIHGNPKRGTGILNNELYLGRLVWNRLRYVKDPATGKRVSRPNPPEAWTTVEVPELRLIDDALWQRAKARQEACAIGPASSDLNRAHRPRYVFSGLLRCASCGASLTMISASHIGCAAARNKGTCDNRRSFDRAKVEARILDALATRLMDPALFAAFCEEYVAETNRLRAEASSGRRSLEAERERIGRDLKRLVDAILEGASAGAVKERMRQLEVRQAEIDTALQGEKEPPPVLHPVMATLYRDKVATLAKALLQDEDTKLEASNILRGLVDRVVVSPAENGFALDLHGDLAGILMLASNAKQPSGRGAGGLQVSLVAGAGFEPAAFRL